MKNSRPMRRLGAALAVAAIVVAPLTPASAAQAAQAAEPCTGADAVTVVVDYQGLDREDGVTCAPAGGGKTAQQILADAKVELEGTAEYGDAVICRVEGLPDASVEPCSSMPRADAYWTLWWSAGTKPTWAYAQEGASTLKVPGGGFVGLSYQEGKAQVAPSLAVDASTQELTAGEAPKVASDSDDSDGSSSSTLGWVAGGLGILLLVAIGYAVRQRRARGGRQS